MKNKTQYSCQSCGFSTSKWLGRCPECGGWNSLVEEKVVNTKDNSIAAVRDQFQVPGKTTANVIKLGDENSNLRPGFSNRSFTHSKELDRVLGGGMVPDGFVLIGGDPGIGKSTLLLQVADGFMQTNPDKHVLYVSG